MRNLIYLFTRFGAAILFVVLEIISFYLIVNYNNSQREIWIHSANIFTGAVNKKSQDFNDYLKLKKKNDSLMIENARLLEKVINYRIVSRADLFQNLEETDSLSRYALIPARVCNQTIHLRNNYLTLCSGSASGLRAGMGVITENGIVGIVAQCSRHYAKVIMILHSQSRISVALKSSGFHGNLLWKGGSHARLNLEAIPKHAEISIGDTIVTSGYSISFPSELPVGVVRDFRIPSGSNSYNIEVQIFNDLQNIEFVYVVDFLDRNEKERMDLNE